MMDVDQATDGDVKAGNGDAAKKRLDSVIFLAIFLAVFLFKGKWLSAHIELKIKIIYNYILQINKL